MVTTTSSPEYLRPSQVPFYFALSRSTVYNLMADGLIKTVSVRRPGNVRGARLVSVESLRNYLSGLSEN